MTAKSFCYACAGIFLLVAAWTMGARHARADFEPDGFPIIGFIEDSGGRDVVLRADGTVWECLIQVPGWQQLPGNLLPPGVAVSDIAFWNGTKVITKSGEMWVTGLLDQDSAWINCGPIPQPTLPVESSTWSGVKEGFRK